MITATERPLYGPKKGFYPWHLRHQQSALVDLGTRLALVTMGALFPFEPQTLLSQTPAAC